MNKIKIDETRIFTSNDKISTRKVLGTTRDIKKDEIVLNFNDLVDDGFKVARVVNIKLAFIFL